jgi:hypothetical protein
MGDDDLSHLMLEQFRVIRAQMDRIHDDVRSLKVELLSLRHSTRSRDPKPAPR